MASNSTNKRGSDGIGETSEFKRTRTDTDDDNWQHVLLFMKRIPGAIPGQDIPDEQLSTLLSAVIRSDDLACPKHTALLGKSVGELKSLIESYPEVKSGLQEGWRIKSFEKIRQSATSKAWALDYKGNHAQVLLDTITEILKDVLHAPYLDIVQSSGAGKSRCIYELGNYLPLISVNLREAEDKTGYPARDDHICQFLVPRDSFAKRPEKKRRCAAFLAGVFKASHDIIEQAKLTNLDPEKWRGLLDQEKKKFDAHAEQFATTLWVYIPLRYHKWTNINNMQKDTSLRTHLDVLTRWVIPAIETFSSCFKGAPRLLLGIDDCHTLIKPHGRGGEEQCHMYDALCSVLHDLQGKNIFVIFMSTHSNLRLIAPNMGQRKSGRASILEAPTYTMQYAPYVSFPFDVYDGGPIINEDELTLTEVCKVEFLCRFGRPLWYTRWESGDDGIKRRIINFAMLKLNGSASLQNISKGAQFAALSIRYQLAFEPDRRAPNATTESYQKALNHEMIQVSSHMRVVHSVPEHREFMRTGTPSEPILAEAAGQLLQKENQVQCLVAALSPLVGQGDREQLAARLLFNLAHDATTSALESDSVENPVYARSIPFLDFFRNLFAEQWFETIANSTPVGEDNRSFKDAFKDCYVHFTHWAKLADASYITTEALWKGLARGVAWQCCDNAPGIGMVIPLLMGKESKLGCGTVTALFVQIEDRSKAQIVTLRKDFASILFEGGKQHPFIFLTMQLGARLSEAQQLRKTAAPAANDKVTHSQKNTNDAKNTPGKVVAQSKTRRTTSNCNRYDISAIGCSPRTYQVIKDEDKDHWQRLLASGTLEEEHPYKGQDHTDLLLQSKPFFLKSSFGWGANKADLDKMETDQHTEELDPLEAFDEGDVTIGGVWESEETSIAKGEQSSYES
ncbi:hypothetical protein HWV62_14834 [Athelia sp. TMB]|nr:hypothetical protein HWV62_14834 [Athelia sp. TMB]